MPYVGTSNLKLPVSDAQDCSPGSVHDRHCPGVMSDRSGALSLCFASLPSPTEVPGETGTRREAAGRWHRAGVTECDEAKKSTELTLVSKLFRKMDSDVQHVSEYAVLTRCCCLPTV